MATENKAYVLVGHGCNFVHVPKGNSGKESSGIGYKPRPLLKPVPRDTILVTTTECGRGGSTSPANCGLFLKFDNSKDRDNLEAPQFFNTNMRRYYETGLNSWDKISLHIHKQYDSYVDGKFIPFVDMVLTPKRGGQQIYLYRNGIFKLKDAKLAELDNDGDCDFVAFRWGSEDRYKNLRDIVKKSYENSVYPLQKDILNIFDEQFENIDITAPETGKEQQWTISEDIKKNWTLFEEKVKKQYTITYSKIFEKFGRNVYYIITCRGPCRDDQPKEAFGNNAREALELRRQASEVLYGLGKAKIGGKRIRKRRKKTRKKSGGVIEIPSRKQHTKTMKKILIEARELLDTDFDDLSIKELEKKRSEAIELLKESKGKHKGNIPIGSRRRLSDGSVIGFRTNGDKDYKKKIKKLGKIVRTRLRKIIGNITKTIRRIKKEEGEEKFWNHEKITVTDLDHAAGPVVRMPAAIGPPEDGYEILEGGKRRKKTRKKRDEKKRKKLGGIRNILEYVVQNNERNIEEFGRRFVLNEFPLVEITNQMSDHINMGGYWIVRINHLEDSVRLAHTDVLEYEEFPDGPPVMIVDGQEGGKRHKKTRRKRRVSILPRHITKTN